MKTLNLFFTLLIAASFLTSCGNDDDTTTITPNQVANKKYLFALVTSQAECDDLLSQGVSCERSVEFHDNTNVSVKVTDILNGGAYVIEGNTITITFSGDPDLENPAIFQANDDFTELTRTTGGNEVYKLNRPGVDPWDL